MGFRPNEILFSPTADCNLNCSHCVTPKSKIRLPVKSAQKFLIQCKDLGIDRVGFTGGEPFLGLNSLCALTKTAAENGLYFDRIMTNAVWYKSERLLRGALKRLFDAGYDGSICISVDDLHKQNLKKIAGFIKTTISMSNRPDIVSIAYVGGYREDKTRSKLLRLSKLLKAHLAGFGKGHAFIRNDSLLIRLTRIDLSPIGRVSRLKNQWDGAWFKEDYCEGPGNVFFILPDGSVKPCCGYATDSAALSIGDINLDSPQAIMRNAAANKFVDTVFNSGLGSIRKRLEALKIKLPGKTSNQCFFCHYLLTKVNPAMLEKCLN